MLAGTVPMIEYLLDEPNTFEIVLNSIEKILSNEIENQVKLSKLIRKIPKIGTYAFSRSVPIH